MAGQCLDLPHHQSRAPSAIREHSQRQTQGGKLQAIRCLFETRWVEVARPQAAHLGKSREEPGGRFGRRKKGGLRRDPQRRGLAGEGTHLPPTRLLNRLDTGGTDPGREGLAAGLVPEMTLSLFIHLFIHL